MFEYEKKTKIKALPPDIITMEWIFGQNIEWLNGETVEVSGYEYQPIEMKVENGSMFDSGSVVLRMRRVIK